MTKAERIEALSAKILNRLLQDNLLVAVNACPDNPAKKALYSKMADISVDLAKAVVDKVDKVSV